MTIYQVFAAKIKTEPNGVSLKYMNTGPQGNYKMTSDTIGKLEEAFALGASVKDACVHAHISRDSYYRWLRNEPGLSDRFERLQLEPILRAKKTIVDHLDDPRIAAWYLERKRRKEYAKNAESVSENEIREEPDIFGERFGPRSTIRLMPGFMEDQNGVIVEVSRETAESRLQSGNDSASM